MLRWKFVNAGLICCVLSCLAFQAVEAGAQSGEVERPVAAASTQELVAAAEEPNLPGASSPVEALPDAPNTGRKLTLASDPVASPDADVSGGEFKTSDLGGSPFRESGLDAFAGPGADFARQMAEMHPMKFAPSNLPELDVTGLAGGHVQLNGMFGQMGRPSGTTAYDPNNPNAEGYHWKALFLESLAFQGVENTYRLLSDTNMRRLLVDKPYWHDYISSMKQWNMRRWWDGDDVLVDYVGHPMQGAVSAFIEIQNSPRQRDLRIGFSREYWRSRGIATLWSAAYSMQQKIGPLGEAAWGSDGGITYPLNCPYPCPSYKPGVTKYTNNTGWTDFIATPVIGTVWVLMEDFLDLQVSDRIQHGGPNTIFTKIVRGTLNPTRTMANLMRWRNPWYRDYLHEGEAASERQGIHFLPSDDVIAEIPKYELFPHFNGQSLVINTAARSHYRQQTNGEGLGFAVRINKWVDFDSDLDYQSNASPLPSDRAGGDALIGTFGFRTGYENKHFALKASVRPGFVSYSKAYEVSPSEANPTPHEGRITHMAAALAINGDVVVTKHVALRAVVDNTAIRYREPYLAAPPPGNPPYLNWLSRQTFLTNENWGYQAGPVLRF